MYYIENIKKFNSLNKYIFNVVYCSIFSFMVSLAKKLLLKKTMNTKKLINIFICRCNL